jgi:hypothetical protein
VRLDRRAEVLTIWPDGRDDQLIVRVTYLSAPSGAIVTAYFAHGVQGDERRFREVLGQV